MGPKTAAFAICTLLSDTDVANTCGFAVRYRGDRIVVSIRGRLCTHGSVGRLNVTPVADVFDYNAGRHQVYSAVRPRVRSSSHLSV